MGLRRLWFREIGRFLFVTKTVQKVFCQQNRLWFDLDGEKKGLSSTWRRVFAMLTL